MFCNALVPGFSRRALAWRVPVTMEASFYPQPLEGIAPI
jgi:hypothetical protein